MVAVLARYARRMGVSPALVRAAESLPPDTMHVLEPAGNAALVVRRQPVLSRVRRAGDEWCFGAFQNACARIDLAVRLAYPPPTLAGE